MYSQLQFLQEVTKTVEEFKGELPEAYRFQRNFNDEVYRDGTLSSKLKRLMAMAIAVKEGCPACITFQLQLALEAGASKEEIVEAVSVATSMGGTTANAWVWIVVNMLKERGKW